MEDASVSHPDQDVSPKLEPPEVAELIPPTISDTILEERNALSQQAVTAIITPAQVGELYKIMNATLDPVKQEKFSSDYRQIVTLEECLQGGKLPDGSSVVEHKEVFDKKVKELKQMRSDNFRNILSEVMKSPIASEVAIEVRSGDDYKIITSDSKAKEILGKLPQGIMTFVPSFQMGVSDEHIAVSV